MPEKGPHLAAEAAVKTGIELQLAGPLPDVAYFKEQVEPWLGDRVRYIGHLTAEELARVVGQASVSVVTPVWEEPFGLIVAESMACGTPVAGFARGALPELVGRTGGVLVAPERRGRTGVGNGVGADDGPIAGARPRRADLFGRDHAAWIRAAVQRTGRAARSMIGYYVHHQGSGHQRRMRAIARHLTTPVTVLSSAPQPMGYDGPWLTLPADFGAGTAVDPTAHGTSHWAPVHHRGLRDRMAAIAGWIQAAQPSLFMVDVSCEVARFVRLMGVPVVVVAMAGDRSDRVHVDAYDGAHALLAPWTAEFARSEWPDRWLEKTWHVGAFSAADEHEQPARTAAPMTRRVALLAGSGGSDITRAQVEQARAATSGWQWQVLGVPGYGGTPTPGRSCWTRMSSSPMPGRTR